MSGPGFAVSSTEKGELLASFNSGENLLAPIPSNFQKYSVSIETGVKVTEQEVDHILDWVDAVEIAIADNHEIPHRLSQKPNKLRGMNVLEQFSFAIMPETYSKLQLNNFMRNLPKIRVIKISAFPLNDAQVREFVANQQPLLSGWSLSFENQDKIIVFKKN